MSRRRDNTDICMWLMAIWTMLLILALNQCTRQDDIDRDLRNIEHELHELHEFKSPL